MSPNEHWLPVVGYEGLYEVSDLGRVKALVKRNTKFRTYLKPSVRPDGYLNVGLVDANGTQRSLLVHRLVLTAFRGDSELPHGAHLNGLKSDNRLCNLMWASVRENASHRQRHGTDGRGEKNSVAKVNAEIVRSIRSTYVPRSRTRGCAALARQHGISLSAVWSIATGKNWSHVV